MRKFLRANGLSVALCTAFLSIWFVGQSWSGLRAYNMERRESDETEVSFGQYLTSAHFGEATFENWESEFLQMAMYVVLTVKLRQRGSAESKPLVWRSAATSKSFKAECLNAGETKSSQE